MRTFILGATGTIGASLTDELLRHGHELVALARSDAAERDLSAKGVGVVRGDLRSPREWVPVVGEVDAVIHVAATFTEDMGEIDSALVDALLAVAERAPARSASSIPAAAGFMARQATASPKKARPSIPSPPLPGW